VTIIPFSESKSALIPLPSSCCRIEGNKGRAILPFPLLNFALSCQVCECLEEKSFLFLPFSFSPPLSRPFILSPPSFYNNGKRMAFAPSPSPFLSLIVVCIYPQFVEKEESDSLPLFSFFPFISLPFFFGDLKERYREGQESSFFFLLSFPGNTNLRAPSR